MLPGCVCVWKAGAPSAAMRGVLTGLIAAMQSSITYLLLFQHWKSIVFCMSARVEKLAAAKTPPQSGFASILFPFAADLFNRLRRFFALRYEEFTGFSASPPTPE
jgi:hypothetical protein